ncbi:armadillo-type protein [Flammula alnicola]|nr:armadillo-type protein [Flammula alnicola]
MTIPTVTVASLKQVKNTVIGNPLAKVRLVKDESFVSTLIDCLNPPVTDIPLSPSAKSSQDALRIEAAHVIASLSYGYEEALGTVLRANAHRAFLYAISHFTRADPPPLRSAFSRALRALATSTADIVGPSLWGLKPDRSLIRSEAQQALDYLFQIESLDIYLPLLLVPAASSPSSSTSLNIATSTAQMLSTTVRSTTHRARVTEWLPPTERQREVKSRRGWEKTALSANSGAPWVARQLVALLGDSQRDRDNKLVEAALSALAALAHENPVIGAFLGKSSPDRDHPPPLANILSFTKSRSVDVQLAACLCVTHILRSSPPSSTVPLPHPHLSLSVHPTSPVSSHASSSFAHSFIHTPASNHPSLEETGTRTVLNVVNRMLALPPTDLLGTSGTGSESPQTKAKACFILHYLVSDDAALCHAAFDRGCMEYLGALIQSITPPEPAPPEWEEGEPESVQSLREASLIALASLALCSDDIRRRITDELRLLPCISRALRAKRHVGTRYAACQCVRAMSRSVSVLRTSIVDSGLGMDVLRIVLGKELGDRFGGSSASTGSATPIGAVGLGKGKEGSRDKKKDEDSMDIGDGSGGASGKDDGKGKGLGEDRRVLGAALSAVCNIVNDFSPLRPIYLEEKLMPRLVYILRQSDDPPLRLNALWAVKNLVRKTSTETKRDIMSHVGWTELAEFLSDPDEEIQEQAFNLLRNLAENEEGIAMVFRELGAQVLEKIVAGLRSPCEDVLLQAAFAIANLANGTPEQQDMILHYPDMLLALQNCLAEATPAVRRPSVSCILVLAQSRPKRRKEMNDAGIISTLKRLCEWSGHSAHGPGLGPAASSVGSLGMSLSPPSSGGHWGGRSPVRLPSSTHAAAPAAGVYGSWGGSGSMHAYAAPHALVIGHGGHRHVPGVGRLHGYGSHHSWAPHMSLEDDRDVVQRARQALEWLEHGETYIS